MKLTIENIKEITTGAADIISHEGKFCFYRLSSEEMEVIKHPLMFAPAGVQMRFKTDAKLLKLKVNARKALVTRSFFSFDVFVNGEMAGSIQNFKDEEFVGAYSDKEYPLGSFEGEFELPMGENTVRIVFPHSLAADVEEVELADATYCTPVKHEKTIIFYGDSITQGFDAVHPSRTYASIIAEKYGANVINKAIGGAGFSPAFAQIPRNEKADLLFVAYGTNDWGGYDLETLKNNTKGFVEGIKTNYPNIPVYVITPLWRKDWQETKKGGTFQENFDVINDAFGKEENMTVIPGIDLVPHDNNMFGDLWLHPNEQGFGYYVDNLLKHLNW